MASGNPGSEASTSLQIRRAVQGDRECVNWVVTHFTPLLKAQAAWRLGPRLRNQVDPEDIVAEAWLIMLRRLGDLDRDEGRATPRLLAFLGTTILHIVNHRIEQAVRAKRRMAPSPSGDDRPDPMGELEAAVTGAVTAAARTELASALDACLSALPDRDREVILIRAVEGLSNQEAAVELGEAPTTVSHRYRRALAKLRESVPGSFLDELLDD